MDVIAVLEIAGAVISCVLLIASITWFSIHDVRLLVALLPATLITVASGFAGLLLWRRHRWGRPLSIVVQALQSVQIQTPLVGFACYVGLKTSVELAARGSWSLGVNVVPLVMLCLLLRANRRTKVAPLEPARNSSLHDETEP
jgi:hypothetical protein